MEGFVAITMASKKLDFNDINKKISIVPSKIIRNGQSLALNRISSMDKWIYKDYYNDDNFGEILNNFLDKLIPYAPYFMQMREKCNIELNCYTTTEWGQLGVILTREIVDKICRLDVGINFHILSYGMVKE